MPIQPTDNMDKPSTSQQVTLAGSINTNANSNTKAELVVKELPKLSVDSPTDMVAVLSFVITAFIVLATTWLTIRNYQKTIDLQDRIASKTQELETTKTRVEILSKNRQDWINTLRDAISEYISVMLSIVELRDLRKSVERDLSSLAHERHVDGIVQWNFKLHSARTTATQLKTKIALLSNPNEDDFVAMLGAMDALHNAVDANKKSVTVEIQSLIEVCQKILKKEWERVKSIQ